ncbi:T9SS type A sorting domain-containing protein [Ferruginibacter sp.]|nr:T9SS type A sorting domain-containing protein [Ferruginibacter sp.]
MKKLLLTSSVFLLALSINAQSISGTVFEDKNYGGGAGRSLAASSGIPRPGAIAELYDAAGSFLSTATTNASGVYTFTGLATGTYSVRIVNSSVSSARSGYITSLFPVQTYCTNALVAGTTVPVQDRVGGEIPAEQDAPANTTSATLTALNGAAGQEVQSIATVAVTGAISATGIDFGFCFDVIVNVNDAGQGSYRQFILNASNLGDEAALIQSGNTWNAISTVNALQALPAGKESTIFMVSSGAVHPGLRAGLPNLLTAGVAVITTSATLYPLLAYSAAPNPDNTSIDGGTQTANVGNNNNIILGTGGTVGVGPDALPNSGDESILSQINGPEVEIAGLLGQYPLQVFAQNTIIRCISIHSNSADLHLMGGGGYIIEQTVIGATATSFTPPVVRGGNSRALIYFDLSATSAVVKNNLIGFSTNEELRMRFWDAINIDYTIINNEIAGGIPGTPGPGPGIATNDNYTFSPDNASAKGTILIKGNLVRDCGPTAISSGVHYNLANANIFQTTVEENTLTRSSAGFQALFGSGNDIILRNIINDNRNMGVRIANRSTDPAVVTQKVKVSQNSIYNNGTNNGALDGLGIDLNEDHVTANTGAYNNTLPNLRMNYPIVTLLSYTAGTLTVAGYVGTAATKSTFANSIVELFKANSTDNNQAGEIIVADGLSVQHGEGEVYLGSVTTNASGDFSFSMATTLVAVGDAITLTATDANNNTSEFSPANLVINILPVTIINFQATKENNSRVKLDWQVGTEINVKEYVIEHSLNGTGFTEIGKVAATGLSNYYFITNNPANGVNFYRLKVVDDNGRKVNSDIRRVNIQNDAAVIIYPSPSRNVINVIANATLLNSKASISIVNMEGKTVLQKNIATMAATEQIDVTNIGSGKYFLRIVTSTEIINKAVQVIK